MQTSCVTVKSKKSSTSVDFYFSHIRGIKMDTNNSETKQGAVVPADLLQQNPHVEVIPT
jgi:hypothetical protein